MSSGGDTMNERVIVWLSTNPFATWLIKNFSARVDPVIFRATNGRLTSMGPPAMPMLTMTAIGRSSGEPRSVHLACVEHEGDRLVVASAMGQQKHPGWRYNIEANPDVQIQVSGESFNARASVLSDEEKENVWSKIREAIPQMNVYEERTDRNIRVFRITRS
jgi:deazaflavin-dependent oxidoreductase (nitroreductase family)